MDLLLNLFSSSQRPSDPKQLTKQLTKDETVKMITHLLMWLDRGPFTQNKSGFEKMLQLSHDPLLIEFFRSKLQDGQPIIHLSLLIESFTNILDSSIATAIFRNTFNPTNFEANFIPAVIETRLKYALAPTQTTLSIDDLWIKRRCLVETALGFRPLGSKIPLESFQLQYPFKNVPNIKSITSLNNNILNTTLQDPTVKDPTIENSIPIHNTFKLNAGLTTRLNFNVLKLIDQWIEENGLPYDNWSQMDTLAMTIVFNPIKDQIIQETNLMMLYMNQAQSAATILGSKEIPFPEIREWYRQYLRSHVQNPNPESLTSIFVEASQLLDYQYFSEEIEDQLPFAFFQINGILKVFFPIALAILCLWEPIILYTGNNQDNGSNGNKLINQDEDLHYFVMEVFRLYNQVFILQRQAAKDLTVGNLNIKQGEQINLMFSLYMRDAIIYPDPDKFDPQRWSQELNIDWRQGQHPFSSGSRTCPARDLAIMIAKHLLRRLYNNHNYQYRLVTELKLDFNKMPQIIDPYQLNFELVPRSTLN